MDYRFLLIPRKSFVSIIKKRKKLFFIYNKRLLHLKSFHCKTAKTLISLKTTVTGGVKRGTNLVKLVLYRKATLRLSQGQLVLLTTMKCVRINLQHLRQLIQLYQTLGKCRYCQVTHLLLLLLLLPQLISQHLSLKLNQLPITVCIFSARLSLNFSV